MGSSGIDVIINIYGNVEIESVKCPLCGESAFLLGGLTACCDESVVVGEDITFNSIMAPEKKRRSISEVEKQRILEEQENRCIYCGIRFGDYYIRNDKTYFAYPNWDHLVPYAYSQNNYESNYVASCRACNSIKSSKMFKTIDDARSFIRKRRIVKGFRIIY